MSAPGSRQPSLAIKFTSAGLAACSAEVATFPFDTAKVRLQVGVGHMSIDVECSAVVWE